MSRDQVGGLTLLHRISDPSQREATWRQSIATLAREVFDQRRPVPLEGLNPEALRQSIQVAVDEGYIDKLDWLSAPAAAAAVYEIAATLPLGALKRDLGRLTFKQLHEGDAATFVALATQLALGSPKALHGSAIRARVALALNLPIGVVQHVDALALALISRQELCAEWLTEPAMGSLPSRRLAARLLERAAREAVRRATSGDDVGVRVFCTPEVRRSWDRLLADRESLVWRHVASARGLLAAAMPAFQEETERHLRADFTITEWRRAAASLGASIATNPEQGAQACRDVLESTIFDQDHGIAAAMIVGLPRAAESHPEVVEGLLAQLVRVGSLDTAEALVDLRREQVHPNFGAEAAAVAESHLRKNVARGSIEDFGRLALMSELADELAGNVENQTLRTMLGDALDKFAKEGPVAAASAARRIVEEAAAHVSVLENDVGADRHDSKQAFLSLRQLDIALFETDALSNLMALAEASRHSKPPTHQLGGLFQRISNWLVIREGDPLARAGRVPQFTARLRRLRTMLHLVDADGTHVDHRRDLVRQRRLLTARVLLSRVKRDPKTPLRRALCAATARACDALVREEIAEVSDVIVATATHVKHLEGLTTMAEASMVPEIEEALRAYARFRIAADALDGESRSLKNALEALKALANELPVAVSPRVEALRRALLDVSRGLRTIAKSNSLIELSERSEGSPLAFLEQALMVLTKLVLGSQRRLGITGAIEEAHAASAVREVGLQVERAIQTSMSEIDRACEEAKRLVAAAAPGAFGKLLVSALGRLRGLPMDAPRQAISSTPPGPAGDAPLPAWVPASRTLGGFRIIRPIGVGAVGSVFVAQRLEERQNEDAPLFALKVPDYTGAAARTLSEEEFLSLFREEAGALLALPEHPNIARFVTFDAGARPKPILVMELVEGPSLDHMIDVRALSSERAIELLQGIGAGLEAMHQTGVSHLDVKPSNIIVRHAEDEGDADPVLVDFGLAGRNLRPGCGTAHYGAPEVWGVGDTAQAHPADVYAYGCVIYEALTGQTLFDGPSDVSLITLHVTHDGTPEPVKALEKDPGTRGLAKLLRSCLRKNPRERVTIHQARQMLAELRGHLSQSEWPIVRAA